MKRKLVLTSAVVLILALLAAGTFAYFTKDARATNVITTGTIDITLNDEIRGGEKTGTGWKLEGVMPGQAVEKKVSITNNGSAEAWLRVKLAVRVTVGGEVKLACVDGPEFDGHKVDYEDLMKRNSVYRQREAEVAEKHVCRMEAMGKALIQ